MVRLLLDANLPVALAVWLRSQGYEALVARDIGLATAMDPELWTYAIQLKAVIATKDLDFRIFAKALPHGPQVLWVRTGNIGTRALISRFEAGWPSALTQLTSGARVAELA